MAGIIITMIMRKKIVCVIVLVSFLSFILLISCQQKEDRKYRDKSKIENRALDKADLLTAREEQQLFEIILDIEKKLGPQLAMVTIDTLNGIDINQYSLSVFEQLELGRELYSDGLLITVSQKDREARIEVGYGLEKIIRDEIAGHILRNEMIPNFKEHKVYEGLNAAIKTIEKLIENNKQLIGEKP